MSTADDAWNEWALHQLRYNLDDAKPAFLAAYRRALEDAAKHLDDTETEFGGVWTFDAAGLRDRAAGVGIDKQDACLSDGELASNSPTKDGDDDE